MIHIGKIKVTQNNNTSRMTADIHIEDNDLDEWLKFSMDSRKYGDFTYISANYMEEFQQSEKNIWFEIPVEYKEGFCSDRADALVVAMLFYAMAVGADIECEDPVSEDLLFNLNYTLLPLMANIEDVEKIQIRAKSIAPLKSRKQYVGTGMSCGVDSLQTLHEFGAYDVQEEFRLTHLTYFNVGADRWYLKPEQSKETLVKNIAKVDEIRKEKIEIAKNIALKKGLGFLYVNSNISDIYQGCFEESHIYRSCAAIMAVQNYFTRYYLSSTGCPYDDYQPKLRIDPGHYEQMLLPCLSTGSLRYINSGKPYTRLEKTEQLQDDEIAQQYLNVCSEKIPCYQCRKDFRTIISMEVLGCGDKFPNFYDPVRVNKVRWHAYLWLLRERNEVVVRDLWKAVKGKKLIPPKSYVAYIIWMILHFLHLK